MVNITHKANSLRQAIAEAIVTVSKPETIEAIQQKRIPKGDVFEFARAAGLLAIKKTSDMIPDCHPLPVEYSAITYHIDNLSIVITVEVHTIYKTGVEVEAMHGAAITALTIYDMLKPVDTQVEISTIRLVSKKGGKSSVDASMSRTLKCAVIVCSDSIATGKGTDTSGKIIVQKLEQYHIPTSLYEVVPDEQEVIRQKAIQLRDSSFDLAIFTGGTGVSPRDHTPEAIAPLLDKEVPGIMETARRYGQHRTPYAMLSRGVAGFAGNMLVLTLPGSAGGAAETMDALFPQLLHVFKVINGERHDQ